MEVLVETELAHQWDVIIVLRQLLEQEFQHGADYPFNTDLFPGLGLTGPANADIGLSACVFDMGGMRPR